LIAAGCPHECCATSIATRNLLFQTAIRFFGRLPVIDFFAVFFVVSSDGWQICFTALDMAVRSDVRRDVASGAIDMPKGFAAVHADASVMTSVNRNSGG